MPDMSPYEALLEIIRRIQARLDNQENKREDDTKKLASNIERLIERSEHTNRDISNLSQQVSSYNGKIAKAVELSVQASDRRFDKIEAEMSKQQDKCSSKFKTIFAILNSEPNKQIERKSKTVGIWVAIFGMLIGFFKFLLDTISFVINQISQLRGG